MMNKSSLAGLVAVAVLGGAFVPAVRGDSPRVMHVDGHHEGSYISTVMCPFPVTVKSSVNVHIVVFFDDSGSPVRRIETNVRPASVSYSANGRTLEGWATGGFEVSRNPDGTRTVSAFGINQLVTIPGYGVVLLDAGRTDIQYSPDWVVEWLVRAGPNEYDRDAFCSALS